MNRRLFLTIPLLAVAAVGLSACEKEKGPAEKAGEAIDEAIGDAGDKLEEVGEKLKEESGQ